MHCSITIGFKLQCLSQWLTSSSKTPCTSQRFYNLSLLCHQLGIKCSAQEPLGTFHTQVTLFKVTIMANLGFIYWLSNFSIVVIKHHDQGNLFKKHLIWGPCLQSERISYKFMTLVVGSRAAGRWPWLRNSSWELTCEIPTMRQRGGERESTGMLWAFESTKPTPSDTSPPARPHLIILPQQFHQLRTKHSNIWAQGAQTLIFTKRLLWKTYCRIIGTMS